MAWAERKTAEEAAGGGSGLCINVLGDSMNMDDSESSFRLGDDGGIQMLSESCSNYHINAEGFSKSSTPSTSTPPGAGGDKYFNCKSSEIRKMQLLGRGASGTVYKGMHSGTNTLLAMKEVNAMKKVSRDQMLNEVRTLCDLPDLEGLVKFYGAFYTQEEGRISILLEYMNAGSLEDLVRLLPANRIPEDVLSAITGAILVGLRYLHEHRQLVHRDIKPANLLINLAGQPKITDFGISSSLINKDNCCTNVGTFMYMSPERLANEPYSFASDIWSIGLTMLELALGRYPYVNVAPVPFILEVTQGDCPLPPVGEFSEEFRSFVSMCMEKDPEDRPNALSLLSHPWIMKHRPSVTKLAGFIQNAIPDAQQRLEEDRELMSQ